MNPALLAAAAAAVAAFFVSRSSASSADTSAPPPLPTTGTMAGGGGGGYDYGGSVGGGSTPAGVPTPAAAIIPTGPGSALPGHPPTGGTPDPVNTSNPHGGPAKQPVYGNMAPPEGFSFPFGSGPAPDPTLVSPGDWAQQIAMSAAGLISGDTYLPSDFASGALPTSLAGTGFVSTPAGGIAGPGAQGSYLAPGTVAPTPAQPQMAATRNPNAVIRSAPAPAAVKR